MGYDFRKVIWLIWLEVVVAIDCGLPSFMEVTKVGFLGVRESPNQVLGFAIIMWALICLVQSHSRLL